MTSRALTLLLLAALALVWFGTLSQRRLVRPDEGRYAEIPREMVASGNWMTPRLNGYKYFEKPALQYWTTAIAFELFGLREWSARLWSALTGFLGIVLVLYAGRRAFRPPIGAAAAAVLAGSLWWALIGHIDTLDEGVSFFMSLSVLGVMIAQLDDATATERGIWMHAAWAAAALATLSKGLIGIVLPGGAFFLYLLIQWDWGRLRRVHMLSGMALFLIIAAPWFIAVSLANKEFFHFFFIEQHFERFLTKDLGRYQPPWYFLPILLVGFSPWIVTLIPALRNAWSGERQSAFRPARFLLVWSVFVFVFFSASDSKLASYILPIFPALSILVAAYAVSTERSLLAWQGALYAAIGLAGALMSPLAMRLANPELPADLLARYVPWIAASGLLMLAFALASVFHAMRRGTVTAIVFLAAGGLTSSLGLLLGHNTLSPAYSAYHIAAKIRPELKPNVPIYTVNTFDHTLPFYLRRTVIMVGYKDELAQSIGWAPGPYLPNLKAFARAWRADRDAWAVFPARDFRRMRAELHLQMHVVARDPRHVVVRKR